MAVRSGYIYEALEIDGANKSEFRLMPTAIRMCRRMYSCRNYSPAALPPCCPKLNPVEGVDDSIRDAARNKVCCTSCELGDVITKEIQTFFDGGAAVAIRIHEWLRLEANSSVPT